jgi:hypothetical protein
MVIRMASVLTRRLNIIFAAGGGAGDAVAEM